MDVKKEKEVEHSYEKQMRKVKTIKYIKTVILILTWVTMGMNSAVQTSCLPDIRTRLNVTIEDFSYAFTLGSIGGLLGSACSGIVDRLFIYCELILGLLMLTCTVFTTSKPLVPSLSLYGVVLFGESISWVLINAAGTVVLLSVWGSNSGGPLQAMHLGFPIGAFLGGLIAVPFVSTNCTLDNSCPNDSWNIDNDGDYYIDNSTIEYAFAIIAMCIFSVALCHFGAQFLKQPGEKQYRKENSSWKDILTPAKWANGDGKFGFAVVCLLCLYFLFLSVSFIGVALYISAYAVDSDLGFTEREAAALNGVINAMGGLGRAVFIPLANHFSTIFTLGLAVHGQLLFMFLTTFVGTVNKTCMWVFVSCYGVFRDPLFPCIYAWGDSHITLLGFIFGAINVVAFIGNTGLNLLLGYLYTNTAVESIFYVTFALTVAVCVVTYIIYFYTRNRKPRHMEQNVDANVEQKTYDNIAVVNDEQKSPGFINTELFENSYFENTYL